MAARRVPVVEPRPLIDDYPVGERARVADPEVQRPLQVQRRTRADRRSPAPVATLC